MLQRFVPPVAADATASVSNRTANWLIAAFVVYALLLVGGVFWGAQLAYHLDDDSTHIEQHYLAMDFGRDIYWGLFVANGLYILLTAFRLKGDLAERRELGPIRGRLALVLPLSILALVVFVFGTAAGYLIMTVSWL